MGENNQNGGHGTIAHNIFLLSSVKIEMMFDYLFIFVLVWLVIILNYIHPIHWEFIIMVICFCNW